MFSFSPLQFHKVTSDDPMIKSITFLDIKQIPFSLTCEKLFKQGGGGEGRQKKQQQPHRITSNSTQIQFSTALLSKQEVAEALSTPKTSPLGLLLSHHGGRSVQNRHGGLESPSCGHKIILKLQQSLPSGKSM